MRRRFAPVALAVALGVVVTLIALWLGGDSQDRDRANGVHDRMSPSRGDRHMEVAGGRGDLGRRVRSVYLEDLKRRWIELEEAENDLQQRDALARESVLRLRWSKEFLELCQFLREQGVLAGGSGDLFNCAGMVALEMGPADLSLLSDIAYEEVFKSYGVPVGELYRWLELAGFHAEYQWCDQLLDSLDARKAELSEAVEMGMIRRGLLSGEEGEAVVAIQIMGGLLGDGVLAKRDLNKLDSVISVIPGGVGFRVIADELLLHKDVSGAEVLSGSLFRRWAEFEPLGAYEFVRSNDLDDAYLRFVAEGVVNGALRDGGDTRLEDVVSEITNQNDRDLVMREFAVGCAWDDPEAALHYANRISSEALREKVIDEVMEQQELKSGDDRY